MISIVLTIILIALIIALLFVRSSFDHWKRLGVYSLTPTFLFGNATGLVFQKTFLGFQFKELYAVFKEKGLRYGGYYFFTKPIFVPVDLDLIKRILNQDFAHFMDHVMYSNETLEPLTAHLYALKGAKWKKLRNKLSPTMTSAKMQMMFPTLLNCTKDLIMIVNKAAEKGEAIDIKEIVSRYATDVIGSCAFGLECHALKNSKSEFRECGLKYFDTSIRDSVIRLMMFLCPEAISFLNLKTMRKEIYDFFMDMITQTVDYREKSGIERKDFLQLLIKLKINVNITDESKGANHTNVNTGSDTSITLNEVAAHCFVLFLGGFETSGTLSTFAFYELVRNPEIQEKLRKEICFVLAKHDGQITSDGIKQMTYLEKFIKEVLRKYPPIPIHFRECTQTYKVPDSNVVLEKGSFVFIPLLGIHHDAEHYPCPEIFDPERFSEENIATRHPAAFIPFGDGPRTCIAYKFGKQQTKVAIITLLRNFSFTLNCKTEDPLVMDPRVPMILTVKGGVWINAKKLSD